ncbi:MAG: SseB family protein [Deltaproteobacteria bacterium]|nr:SseB family protein [Deltaproteobacteria bacterium]
MDDRNSGAFRTLLSAGAKGPGPKSEVLEALSLRPVWLATWEPRAEGFRTLINAEGEEALAVFSSQDELKSAAKQFDWLEDDGTVATHRSIGGDILRHAWTREYAFVVIDIGTSHSLEYARDELKSILREMDSTGPFATSRPPPAPDSDKPAARSSFAPPVERISTLYSMGPGQVEKIERLSELPTQPHEIPFDSEPPTQPRAALQPSQAGPKIDEAPTRQRKSSRPAHKPKTEPPGQNVEEVSADSAPLGEGGTYGAASSAPKAGQPSAPVTAPSAAAFEDGTVGDSEVPLSSSAPKLHSDAPTAPAAQPLPSLEPHKLNLPPVEPVGPPPVAPKAKASTVPPADGTAPAAKPPAVNPTRIPGPSIGDGIRLVELRDPPNEDWLKAMADVLRGFFEIEWASYCEVARKNADPTAAIGLRITDNYRDNVTAIIKQLIESSQEHEMQIDVLLIDGHDMLRKARERGFVFYPWKPKPFGR